MNRRQLLLTGIGIGLGATGCAAEGPPSRTVSMSEAEQLAAVLFLNHDAGGAALTMAIPGAGTITGNVDWRQHLGIGELRDTSGTIQQLAWTLSAVALADSRIREGWIVGPLEPKASAIHLALATSIRLAVDRPENPQLLVNNDAQWLRIETVDGESVNVYSGPRVLGDGRVIEAGRQRLNYWIAHDGFLRRVAILAGQEPITIDLTNLGPQQLRMPAGLAW